ncbi:hypothetical protein [Croceicoccus sp. BE223]|uniref:hypothetical protein n=1 Tax=Croceicoccus sp. BE223 TaxID=2817716 RepID=UPI00286796B2|nr:hypothetical protein [Croceicoccus sp. BE223]MDR7104109.1 hypothetical protein [Croceicoccus sp. BE223]
MGSFHHSQHELIYVWMVNDATPINNFGLSDTGRYRTNNTFHAGRDAELAAHPTVKPLALVADAMRDCSHRGRRLPRRLKQAWCNGRTCHRSRR